jgi:hypothetical protein
MCNNATMSTQTGPGKQAKRELPRWAEALRLSEEGKTVIEIGFHFDVTTNQVYALLKNAKIAREKGWI